MFFSSFSLPNSHLLAKNMDGQNFREFMAGYANYIMKNKDAQVQNSSEKDPILNEQS